MNKQFTDRARAMIAQAQREAQRLGHDFVGTEHLLLGLVEDGVGLGAEVLEALGATPQRVRAEIEALLTPEPAPTTGEHPLTPRAQRALELAAQEAGQFGQDAVDSEHIFIGLASEPDGVAAKVLNNLGPSVHQFRARAFKVHLQLMAIVERAIRPVHAITGWKRKRREELLAHLTAIFDDEHAGSHCAATAVAEAAKRFGDSIALSKELQSTVPWSDRAGYVIEKYLGWRAPETATHWIFRLVAYLAAATAGSAVLCLAAMGTMIGVNDAQAHLLWSAAAFVVLLPSSAFAVGLLYIKIRDAHYGVFGSRKSRVRAVVLGIVMAAAIFATGVGLTASAATDRFAGFDHETFGLLASVAAASLAIATAAFVLAWFNGRSEIHDTIWALLDLEARQAVDEA